MASGEIKKNMLCEYLDVYIIKSNHLSENLNDHTGNFQKATDNPPISILLLHTNMMTQ